MRPTNTLSAALRLALRADGRSIRAIGRATGVSEANLSRFLAGKSGLTLATVDRLAAAMGLRLVKE